MHPRTPQPILALGGTGKTGRRVAQRLRARGQPVRIGTPSAAPPFDWNDPATWPPALDGVGAVYLAYYPDLAVPGAVEAVRSFAELAVGSGVPRLALLSGRGEPEAERAEQAVAGTGAELTVLRCSWFMQNFSEDYMLAHVLAGELRLPAGEVPTPFLDADDIAEVAVAALTDDRHIGQLYESAWAAWSCTSGSSSSRPGAGSRAWRVARSTPAPRWSRRCRQASAPP
jgi:uncharacterized protein YbjT (DUF2867 family)